MDKTTVTHIFHVVWKLKTYHSFTFLSDLFICFYQLDLPNIRYTSNSTIVDLHTWKSHGLACTIMPSEKWEEQEHAKTRVAVISHLLNVTRSDLKIWTKIWANLVKLCDIYVDKKALIAVIPIHINLPWSDSIPSNSILLNSNQFYFSLASAQCALILYTRTQKHDKLNDVPVMLSWQHLHTY